MTISNAPTATGQEGDQEAATAAFAERLSGSMLGAFDVLSIYLGDQLELYGPLSEGWHTSAELARRASIAERYAREWLEQQTVSGMIVCEDPTEPADRRRFRLPAAHAAVLSDRDSLTYLTPFARVIAASAVQLPSLLSAYRDGDGVSWAQYGDPVRSGQAEANRPLFLHELGSSWLPSVPGVHAALSSGGRVADIGCGEGWSTIAIALAYPTATVVGIDPDPESIEAARAHAAEYGVGDRIGFVTADAAGALVEDGYDLVTAFECVHDMADPVAVLAAMRRMARPGAPVLVMDEGVSETFTGEPDFVEQLMYGMSLMVCLPDGMSHSPSAGTGTVMRPAVLGDYAARAGFSAVDVLPIEHEMFRFYSLNA